MKRAEHWRPAFFAAITAHRPFPFAWGEHDCALLTADCIVAVTGLDLAAPFRGRYATEEQSRAVLAEVGYENTAAILAAHFNEIHPSRAIVGDAAVIRTPHGPAVAPVVGSELVVFSPDGPMGLVSRSTAVRAFRIEIRET